MRISDWSSDVCSSDLTAEKAENLTRFQPDRALHVDRDADGVTLTLAGGETIHGALLVAAEGRNSPTREVEGIRTTRWNYRHVAMVTAIDHEVPHANTAYEIFYPGGPFALLPMRSEERRVGQEGVSTGRNRWSPVQ